MKNYHAILICLILVLITVACGGAGSEAESNPNASQPTENGMQMKTIKLSINLDDLPSAALIKQSILVTQVTQVAVEVIIEGTIFSTTTLQQNPANPLSYSGEISIPVDVAVDLHAIASSADGTLLFEGNLTGVQARAFDQPAIQIVMQRRLPVEETPPANSAPLIKGIIFGDTSLAYGQATPLVADAEDPQDDPITYLWSVTSAPTGVDTTLLLTQANQPNAIFTAGNTDGIYTIRVTVSDPDAASSFSEMNIYVSQTGLDSTPDTGVIISDFPDCVQWPSGNCSSNSQVGNVNYNSTRPNPIILNPSFRYQHTNGINTSFTATQLLGMGFTFSWSDTCNGNNFLETSPQGNQSLQNTSTQFVPSFIKSGLNPEICQISLVIRNPDGLSQTYQATFNFSNTSNNRGDVLNCNSDPSNTRPKVRLTCPSVMTEVPQFITVEMCDAQNDINIWYGTGTIWAWSQQSNIDRYITSYFSGPYVSGFGSTGDYNIILIPYNYNVSSTQLSNIDADYVSYASNLTQQQINSIQAIEYTIQIDDAQQGNSGSSATCVIPVDPNINLTIPAGYFNTPRP